MVTVKIDHSIQKITSLLLYVDGGCEPKNPGGVATSGWVLYEPSDPNCPLVEEGAVVQDGGPKATNNFGEYQALCRALHWLDKQKWRGNLVVKADSKLLIEQVCNRWKVKAEHLKPLRQEIWMCMDRLKLFIISSSDPLPPEGWSACELMWVGRDYNQYANDLCRNAYQEYKNSRSN